MSRLTDRRRQRGPSAGAAAHAARHLSSKIRTPGASLGVRSIEARQILARFSDDASFPTYLFLYSLLYFGDVIYCKYPSSKYRREYRFPLCEACLYIVKKKTRAAFPLFTPSHRPKLDRARSPPRAVRRARAVCPCQRPLPPIDRLWADSCKRFSAYRWWPVAGTGRSRCHFGTLRHCEYCAKRVIYAQARFGQSPPKLPQQAGAGAAHPRNRSRAWAGAGAVAGSAVARVQR